MTYRHELKYLIHDSDYAVLRMRVAGLLKRDTNITSHGFYTVRSLYFDDFYNTAYDEKYMSILNRQKFRIRSYNHSADVIRLERKIRISDNYVNKLSIPLTQAETALITQGDYGFLRYGALPMHKILYYEVNSKVLRPRIIIDYEREPYTGSWLCENHL